MRNYYRFVVSLAILFILGISAFILWGKYGIKGYTRNDEITVQLNEIKTDVEEAWDNLDNLRERDYEADYLILDMQNRILLMNAKSSGEYEDFTRTQSEVVAALAAPALVQMGVPIIAAHLFLYYFGMMANVTPPVALAAYVPLVNVSEYTAKAEYEDAAVNVTEPIV